jgi:hypothetical protein
VVVVVVVDATEEEWIVEADELVAEKTRKHLEEGKVNVN